MKETLLYGIWGFLFILCACLGFIPDSVGFGRFLLSAAALLFFVPGGILLYNSVRKKDKKQILIIRYISLTSLCLTLLLLILNIASVGASEKAGIVLDGLLTIFASPMGCCRYPVVSLFLWAYLLMGSFYKEKDAKKQ